MWKGNVARTERNGRTLNIIISYTNGINNFDETISTDSPQGDTWLPAMIKSRLEQLNQLDTFEDSIKIDSVFTAKDITVEEIGTILIGRQPKIDPIPVELPVIK